MQPTRERAFVRTGTSRGVHVVLLPPQGDRLEGLGVGAPGLSPLVRLSLRSHLDPVKRRFRCKTMDYQGSCVRNRTSGDPLSTKTRR